MCVGVGECWHVCVWVCVRVVMGARALAYACARVALIFHHATRRHIVICGLSVCTIFLDIIS